MSTKYKVHTCRAHDIVGLHANWTWLGNCYFVQGPDKTLLTSCADLSKSISVYLNFVKSGASCPSLRDAMYTEYTTYLLTMPSHYPYGNSGSRPSPPVCGVLESDILDSFSVVHLPPRDVLEQ